MICAARYVIAIRNATARRNSPLVLRKRDTARDVGQATKTCLVRCGAMDEFYEWSIVMNLIRLCRDVSWDGLVIQ